MITKTYIGIKNNDGTVTTTYMHNAGTHITFSRFLQTYITTEKSVREILSYGEISSLCNETEHDYFVNKFGRENNEWEQMKTATNVFIRKVNTQLKSITVSSVNDCIKNKICATYMFDPKESKWYYITENGVKLLEYKTI